MVDDFAGAKIEKQKKMMSEHAFLLFLRCLNLLQHKKLAYLDIYLIHAPNIL